MSSSFSIEVFDLHWKGDVDPALDYCAHGAVEVRVGDEVIVAREELSEWAVNVTVIYLLRTLEHDHIMDSRPDYKLMQKCGHALVYNECSGELSFASCPMWRDWSVVHENDMIKLCTANGAEAVIPFEEYKTKVLAFADKVGDFYMGSSAKLPYNDSWTNFKRFADEWAARRRKWR